MLGGYFDEIYLFSESPDPQLKHIGATDRNTYTDAKKWEDQLTKIFKKQERLIKRGGKKTSAPYVLLVFEDIINNKRFMHGSQNLIRAFTSGRHYNSSVMVTSQDFTALAPKCRSNAHSIYFWAGIQGEHKKLCDQFCPPHMTKREFLALIYYCTKAKYSFMTINTKQTIEDGKFRRGFTNIIEV
jgi:hypothetical protein